MANDSSMNRRNLESLIDRVGLRAFEVFFEVVERGSFSAAAEELNLSQPTVSQHVKTLEKTLGEPLLVRRQDGVRPTKLGRTCHEELRSLRAVKDDLEEELKTYFNVGRQNLTMAASTIPGEFMLPAYLPGFLAKNPSVRVDLKIQESDRLLDRVDEGELRWGVTGRRRDESTLEFTPLFVDRMILVAAPENVPAEKPLSYEDFRDLRYVGRGPRSGSRRAVVDRFESAGFNPGDLLDPVARVGTVQAVREALLNGLGVGFLPASVVSGDLEADRLRELPTEFSDIERTFYGVENRFVGTPPVVDRFLDYLRASLPGERTVID